MSFANWIKPSKTEATVRLRNSGAALVTLLTLAYLLPLPSPLRAILVVSLSWDVGKWTWLLCFVESLIFMLLSLNVAQSVYALKNPRGPLPATPAPPRTLRSSPEMFTPTRNLVSPEFKARSPLPQKSFSASVYAPSPISTPSRTLDYSVSSSVFDSSFSSSFSLSSPSPSVGGSTSSPLSAYKGRRGVGVGRPLDGSFLRDLARADDN